MATANTHTVFGEVRQCGFRADRQTDKQTYSSQYFAPLQGAKYRKNCGVRDSVDQRAAFVGSKLTNPTFEHFVRYFVSKLQELFPLYIQQAQ